MWSWAVRSVNRPDEVLAWDEASSEAEAIEQGQRAASDLEADLEPLADGDKWALFVIDEINHLTYVHALETRES